MLARLPLATACYVDPGPSNGVRASACRWGYEAALCLKQKTIDSELIIVDRRGAKHCGAKQHLQNREREMDGQKEGCGEGGDGGRDQKIRKNMV